MLAEKVRGLWEKSQNKRQLRRHITTDVAAGMRSQAFNVLYTLLGIEATEPDGSLQKFRKNVRSQIPILANYLVAEAQTIADIVASQNSDVQALSPKESFLYFSEVARKTPETPDIFYDRLDSLHSNGIGLSSEQYKALSADLKLNAAAVLYNLNQLKDRTVITYVASDLGSVTPTTRAHIVRPRAFGANAAKLNAGFQRNNLGFVIKDATDDHAQTEEAVYVALGKCEGVKTAARFLGRVNNAVVLTPIQHQRLAEFVEGAEKYRKANPASGDALNRLYLATKHAHLRQVALAHQALKEAGVAGEEAYVGMKLYDAMNNLLAQREGSSAEADVQLFEAAIVIEQLLSSGQLAPRIDPSRNNAWFDAKGKELEGMVSFAEGASEESLLQHAISNLYISDFKRASGLYPKFDDAIEVHLNTGTLTPEDVLKTCKVFNAMATFYSIASVSEEQEARFLNALFRWETGSKEAANLARNFLKAYHSIDPEDLPAADTARALTMTAVRLLRWSEKVKDAPMISTAEGVMINRDPVLYAQKAAEMLQMARHYSALIPPEENSKLALASNDFTDGFTLEKALDYVGASIQTLQLQPSSVARL